MQRFFEEAAVIKEKGNVAFKEKEFEQAVALFTDAISILLPDNTLPKPSVRVFLANYIFRPASISIQSAVEQLSEQELDPFTELLLVY